MFIRSSFREVLVLGAQDFSPIILSRPKRFVVVLDTRDNLRKTRYHTNSVTKVILNVEFTENEHIAVFLVENILHLSVTGQS